MSEASSTSNPSTYLSLAALGISVAGPIYNNQQIRSLQGNVNTMGTYLHSMIDKVNVLQNSNRGIDGMSETINELKELIQSTTEAKEETEQAINALLHHVKFQQYVLSEFNKSIAKINNFIADQGGEIHKPNIKQVEQPRHKPEPKKNKQQVKKTSTPPQRKPQRKQVVQSSSKVRFDNEDDLLTM